MWDALRLDVRHSFRSLRRAPTFSVIVIVTLTMAVGATTAVGSLLNALVLRTAAVPSPEQLVALSALDPRAHGEDGVPAVKMETFFQEAAKLHDFAAADAKLYRDCDMDLIGPPLSLA